ncbi:FMN-binding negative transcriptional regulator [Rhizobium sp. KVB221]|uniref:FMN-binding negative transcriptional regulator n=1 Tax=Rhizobium setariae TaxID=2801340 RepID=A0A936YRT2_9HYPH|nr:FMN-binding negative transcriptional regulator [Rhizobium setariae]MBL0371175.1 FMN-binding negative transcriptional regulator [Rhizobium setariae]
MYQPPHFREERTDVLHALMRAHPLATLIATGPDGEPEANVIPMLLDEGRGAMGTLKAHVARANPQWKILAETGRALVIFQGPDAYITPSWYVTKEENHKVVPTWNYAIVQVRGNVTVHQDAAWLAQQIRELTQSQEGGRKQPWAVDDAPQNFIDAQIRGIVGLEIEITAIEGKWKVSQNRPAADRTGVVQGLEAEGNVAASDMAGLVKTFGG